MKTIQHNVMKPHGEFIIDSESVPRNTSLGDRVLIEDEYFFGRGTITGVFLNGNIEITMISRSDHPSRTVKEAIAILQTYEANSMNNTMMNLLGNFLSDWKKERVNTRALELVATLAYEIKNQARKKDEDTSH